MTARRITFLLVIFIGLSYFLRLFYLGDMEFKGDEAGTVQYIARIFDQPYSPHAPVAAHSGFAHHSGFFYFVHLISFGTRDPLWMATSIALFNATVLAVLLYLTRHSKKLFFTIALSITCFELVVGSRKIWTPDLVAPFILLGVGLLGLALSQKDKKASLVWAVLGGFFLTLAPQSYPAGGGISAIFGGATALALLLNPRLRKVGFAWIGGLFLGFLTFLPYLIALFTHAPGTFSNAGGFQLRGAGIDELLKGFSRSLTLPSDFSIYQLFLRPISDWLTQFEPNVVLDLTLGFIFLSGGLSLALYWLSLIKTFQRPRELKEDPIALGSLAALIFIPFLLFYSGLGNFIHYWWGVIPLCHYLIGRAIERESGTRIGRVMAVTAWANCLITATAIVFFYILVHQIGGLAGEYGPAYRITRQHWSP